MNSMCFGRWWLMISSVTLVLVLGVPSAWGQFPFGGEPTLQGPGSTIGIEIRDRQAADASASDEGGAVVAAVRPDTPAARAGFQAGDIVLEFDGERVRGARQLARVVAETRPGRAVKATVLRNGSRQTLDVTPELGSVISRPEAPAPALRVEPRARVIPFEPRLLPPVPAAPAAGRLGISVMTLEPQLGAYFGAERGVLITAVTDDSPASKAGLKAGDVIVEIASRPVTRTGDVTEALRTVESGGSLELRLRRDKKDVRVTVALPPSTPQPERRTL